MRLFLLLLISVSCVFCATVSYSDAKEAINALPDDEGNNLKEDLNKCFTTWLGFSYINKSCIVEAFKDNDISDCEACKELAEEWGLSYGAEQTVNTEGTAATTTANTEQQTTVTYSTTKESDSQTTVIEEEEEEKKAEESTNIISTISTDASTANTESTVAPVNTWTTTENTRQTRKNMDESGETIVTGNIESTSTTRKELNNTTGTLNSETTSTSPKTSEQTSNTTATENPSSENLTTSNETLNTAETANGGKESTDSISDVTSTGSEQGEEYSTSSAGNLENESDTTESVPSTTMDNVSTESTQNSSESVQPTKYVTSITSSGSGDNVSGYSTVTNYDGTEITKQTISENSVTSSTNTESGDASTLSSVSDNTTPESLVSTTSTGAPGTVTSAATDTSVESETTTINSVDVTSDEFLTTNTAQILEDSQETETSTSALYDGTSNSTTVNVASEGGTLSTTPLPTTRILQDGTKILNETATAFDNCTMLIVQTRLLANQTIIEWSQWFDTGCTEGKIIIPGEVTAQMLSTITETDAASSKATTIVPTTKVMQDGTKILNETAIAFENCTMLITQTRLAVNQTQYEWSEWFDTGCTEGDIIIPGEVTQAPPTNTSFATTFSDVQTTRVMLDGTKILNESAVAYANCTMLITQTRLHSNNTVTEWSEWFETGCTEGKIQIPGEATIPIKTTTESSTNVTENVGSTTSTYIPTTRTMLDGTKILNESATAYANCTMLITQTRLLPDQTTTEWSEWFDTGCTQGSILIPGEFTKEPQQTTRTRTTTTSSETSTNETETSLSTADVSGEAESSTHHPNVNTSTTVSSSSNDSCPTDGIVASTGSSIQINGSMLIHSCDVGWAFSDKSPLRIYSCENNEWVGYENETCSPMTCSELQINLENSNQPTSGNSFEGRQDIGTMIIHTCKSGYTFSSGEPLRIYECLDTGIWTSNIGDSCTASRSDL